MERMGISQVEERFSRAWGARPREGWQLERESEVLHIDQKVFTPDFVLKRENGRRTYLEIVGFWTPEYLEQKAATLRKFRNASLLLAVPEKTRAKLPELDLPVVWYKSALRVDSVLAKLNHESL